MSKKRWVDTKFWDDVWVVDRLNPLDRYLMLYFLTNNKTTIAGVYEISLRTISNETGIEKDEVLRMVVRLEPRVRYVDGWIVLQNGIKNQSYNSPKVKTGIEIVLDKCPDSLLQFIHWPADWKMPENIIKRLKKQGSLDLSGYPMDIVSHSDPDPNSNSNPDASQPLINKKQKPEKASPEAIEKFRQKRRDLGL